jgi:hypothetical protein
MFHLAFNITNFLEKNRVLATDNNEIVAISSPSEVRNQWD